MLSTNSVWDRRELTSEAISEASYNLTIGLVLTWGFGVNYLMIQNIPAEAILGVNRWVFLIGYIASIFAVRDRSCSGKARIERKTNGSRPHGLACK